MINIDALSKMLPLQAKEALTKYFLVAMEKSGINYYNNSKYNFSAALRDFPLNVRPDAYPRKIAEECFKAAEKEYERLHPLCWSDEKKISWRKGINEL